MSVARASSVAAVVCVAWLAASVSTAEAPQAPKAPAQTTPAAQPAQPAQPVPPAPATKAAPETKVVTTEAIHALVLPMKGSYMQHQAAFERLGGFLAQKGVMPSSAPFGRYLNDASVGDDNLLWEVGFPVAATVAAEAPFEVKDIPGELTAVRVHRGPYEELATAWPDLVAWVGTNGYQAAGPPLQFFRGDPFAPEVEMRLPVKKVK
jgi:effector-binding domain-containing protein